MWKDGTSLCDVTVTLILQEKIRNIFFLKWNIFLQTKIDRKHFYPKIPTGAQISTQRPTLLPHPPVVSIIDVYKNKAKNAASKLL